MIRKILLVIIAAVALGYLVFKLTLSPQKQSLVTAVINHATQPSSTPKPSVSPINSSTNLKQENLSHPPEDFSPDYQDLKATVNSF